MSAPARLARVRHWVRARLDTLSARIAANFTAGTLLFLLLGAAFSSLYFGDLLHKAEVKEVTASARAAGERVANAATVFTGFLIRLSEAEEVGAALVDSAGVERHLRPFLRLARAALEEYALGAGDVTVTVTDYRGRPIEGELRGVAATLGDAPWIGGVLKGAPHAEFSEETGMLLVALPVVFAATGVPEGMVVGTIDLNRLVKQAAGTTAAAVRVARGEPTPGSVVTPLALREPLAALGLHLEAKPDMSAVNRQIARALAAYVLLLLPFLALTIVLAGLLGRRIGAPIRSLADWATSLHSQRLSPPPVAQESTAEMRELAQALQGAIGEIEANEAALRRFRLALDATQNGAVIVDAQAPGWPVIYANRAFTHITGYAADEVLGGNLSVLHSFAPDQPELERLRTSLRAGSPCRVLLRNHRKDGREFWNDLSVAPIRGADGALTHFIGVQSDVTERLQTEAHLRDAHKFEAIGQLTGGLAHDFNNLLGMVVGHLDLLKQHLPDDARALRLHRLALDAALRGADVTKSLLAVARRQRLELRTRDLNELVTEVLPLVQATVGPDVTVVEQLLPEPLAVDIDSSALSNVLLNLAINARDAMKGATGMTLTLRTRRERAGDNGSAIPGAGEFALLQVTDTGRGMAPEILARAWEPFYTTKAPGEGTGLGLAMTKGFVEQLGGRASLESAPGRGTTVSILLPLSPTAPAPAPSEVSMAERAARDTATAERAPRALVVDDEEGLRTLAGEWLGAMGFEVESAASAEDALPRLESGQIDLLFTDVVMPGSMDGLTLARRALAARPGLRVVITSGYAKSLLETPDLPGAFLPKPYRRRDLVRAVEQTARQKAR